jgi:hypothetical protein
MLLNGTSAQWARKWLKRATLLFVGACSSHAHATESDMKDVSLQTFLQEYLKGSSSTVDPTTRYSVAKLSLDDKTQMDFVYISGQRWCGSGGCTALLLRLDRTSFKVIEKFSLVRLPILVLPNLTNGWHDIALWVRGGGASGRPAVLRYNGARYPSNPSTEPAPHLTELPAGGIELPLRPDGDLLYP